MCRGLLALGPKDGFGPGPVGSVTIVLSGLVKGFPTDTENLQNIALVAASSTSDVRLSSFCTFLGLFGPRFGWVWSNAVLWFRENDPCSDADGNTVRKGDRVTPTCGRCLNAGRECRPPGLKIRVTTERSSPFPLSCLLCNISVFTCPSADILL